MRGNTNAQPDAYIDATYRNSIITLTKQNGSKTELMLDDIVKFTLKVEYTGSAGLSGIAVTATPSDASKTPLTATTDASGVVRLSVEQYETYTISSVKEGCSFSAEPTVLCENMLTVVQIGCYLPGSTIVTVSDGKGASVIGRTVTATCPGQTAQAQTITAGTSVAFSLPAGTWTFSVDKPGGASATTSVTQTIESGESYSITLSIVYSQVFGVRIAIKGADPYERVTYPQTIFDQPNGAYGRAPCTNVQNAFKANGWDGCELISGIKRQILTTSKGWEDVVDKKSAVAGSTSQEVYTYFPTWYMKWGSDGTNLDIAFSATKLDDTWEDLAGSIGGERVGHFRIGCFCTPSASSVKSYGGVKAAHIALADALKMTQTDKGAGWDIMAWYQWNYLSALQTLLFKTTDLQAALGRGYTDMSGQSARPALTYSNDYGMYGDTTKSDDQMSFFWIQNLYGDYWQWCGGAHADSKGRLETCTGYSSVDSFDRKELTPAMSEACQGAVDAVAGTNDGGFFPTSANGSFSTYFSDYGFVPASGGYPSLGGDFYTKELSGPFYIYFNADSKQVYAVRPVFRL